MMRHERQVELLRRLQAADAPRPGPLGESSMHNSASAYTSAARFDDELRVLFTRLPQLAALSCEVAETGSFERPTGTDERHRCVSPPGVLADGALIEVSGDAFAQHDVEGAVPARQRLLNGVHRPVPIL